MELSLDIVRNDTFSYVNLQRVAGTTTYVPQALGALGLFESTPINGEIIHLYEEDGVINLVPTTERGTPDVRMIRDQGRIRALKAPRIGQIDNVQASELLGIANTNLAEPIRIRNAQTMITKRTAKMKSQLEATKELHRLGAMSGKLLDADGVTVIADFFDLFGLSAPTLIDVDFPNIPEEQLLQFFQDTFLRPITIALMDGGRMTPGVQLGALCSDGWWAKLMTHPGFRKIYTMQQTAISVARATNPLVQPNMWGEVDFAGVRWINYMGMRSGPVAIPANECRFFPIGAPDVFRVYWASGETLLDVDKPGQPEYLYLQPDPRDQMPAYLEVVLRSYPLYACIFPKALMRARVKPTS